jgi:hypothetical protein
MSTSEELILGQRDLLALVVAQAKSLAVLRDPFALGNHSDVAYRLTAIEDGFRARNANAQRKR